MNSSFTTDSVHDTRSFEQKTIESFSLHNRNTDTKPKSNYFKVAFPLNSSTLNFLAPLRDIGGQYLEYVFNFDAGDPSYSFYFPNTLLSHVFSVLPDQYALDFSSLDKVELSLNGSIFRRPTGVAFASDFTFPVFAQLAIVDPDNINVYQAIDQAYIGDYQYETTSGNFALNIQYFQLLNDSIFYNELSSGNSRVLVIIGFDDTDLSVAQRDFIASSAWIMNVSANMIYSGMSFVN